MLDEKLMKVLEAIQSRILSEDDEVLDYQNVVCERGDCPGGGCSHWMECSQ